MVTAASSAGGCDVNHDYDMHMAENSDPGYVLHVYGLQGGHSGGEIHKERGNANILAARILEEAQRNGIRVNLVSLEGGSKDNAITLIQVQRASMLPHSEREGETAVARSKRQLDACGCNRNVHHVCTDVDETVIVDTI